MEKRTPVLIPCEYCGESYNEADACEECCEHEFDSSEGYICLNCGKDGSEDVMSDAYDRAKALRQDG